jgi:hypothetical protein
MTVGGISKKGTRMSWAIAWGNNNKTALSRRFIIELNSNRATRQGHGTDKIDHFAIAVTLWVSLDLWRAAAFWCSVPF